MRSILFLCLLLVGAGCVSDLQPRECAKDADCLQAGEIGHCLATTGSSGKKWCAFHADSCISSEKWGILSGDGLGDSCVTLSPLPADAGLPDSPFEAPPDAASGPDAPVLTVDAPNIQSDAQNALDGPTDPDASPPQLTIDPPSHDFGSLAPGQTVVQAFAIANAGGEPTGRIVATLGGADASSFVLDAADCKGVVLQPHESCSVIVTFSTDTEPGKQGTLSISATPGGSRLVALSGSGLSPAALSADPPSLSFSPVVTGSSGPLDVTLSNDGELATATLSTSISGMDQSQFATQNDMCNGHSVASKASCSITVVFRPTSGGSKSASLTVAAGGRSATVPLSGTGLPPGVLTTNPPNQTFATTGLGSNTTSTIIVTNGGGATVTSLVTSISGGNASDFSIVSDACQNKSLIGGASCAVAIKFQPLATGNRISTFSVSGSSSLNASSNLAGSATAHVKVIIDSTWCVGKVVSVDPADQNKHIINCGTTCEADFLSSSVILEATGGTRADGAPCALDLWTSPSACGSSGTCTVYLSSSQAVVLSFTPPICVDSSSGSDASSTRGTCATPFKTVTNALAVAQSSGNTFVQVKPGTYSTASGEVFPIVVPTGVTLVGDELNRGNGGAPTSLLREQNSDLTGTLSPSPGSTIAGIKIPVQEDGFGIAVMSDHVVIRSNTIVGSTNAIEGIYFNGVSNISIVNNEITLLTIGIGAGGNSIKIEDNDVHQNTTGLNISGGDVDLGGGLLSHGGNTFSCNQGVDVFSSVSIRAWSNFWDHPAPTTASTNSSENLCGSGEDFCGFGVGVTVDASGSQKVPAGACP